MLAIELKISQKLLLDAKLGFKSFMEDTLGQGGLGEEGVLIAAFICRWICRKLCDWNWLSDFVFNKFSGLLLFVIFDVDTKPAAGESGTVGVHEMDLW